MQLGPWTVHVPSSPPPGPSPAQAPTSILTKGTALPRGLRRTRAGGSGAREDVPAAKWLTLSGAQSFICTQRVGLTLSHTPHPTWASPAAVGSGAVRHRGWGPGLKMEVSLQKILGVLFSVLSFSLFSHLSKLKKKKKKNSRSFL